MSIRFYFRNNESAPKLFNSLGKPKGRIHFFPLDSFKVGEDKFALAVEKIPKEKLIPKLNWIDRKIFILHLDKNSGTYYKINKLSLKKRLNISGKSLKEASHEGKIGDLIEKKLKRALVEEANHQANHLAYLCRVNEKFTAKDEKKIIDTIQSLPKFLVGLTVRDFTLFLYRNFEILESLMKTLQKKTPNTLFQLFYQSCESYAHETREDYFDPRHESFKNKWPALKNKLDHL